MEKNYNVFLHFLLKYTYTSNWEREVNENYFPVSIETVLKKIPKNYAITHKDLYVLPYKSSTIKNDFGILLKHSTHAKLIIERK